MISGLKGTIRISKLFNDTSKVKELMLWWSDNVGNRISELNEETVLNSSIASENETIKGNFCNLMMLRDVSLLYNQSKSNLILSFLIFL